ncbi:MAG TPA: FG-GAP-like repeat-containing protein [Thermoanaerobaculia bacterium]|nr:FG-GAP-like repeat-containing protein [Thermoanaerobaculia bacterium]
MPSRPVLKRWTHRRVLMALGLAGLGACAILWFTRKGDEAPYTPGAAVEGVTDVLKKEVSGAGWGVVFKDVAKSRGIDFSHFSAGPRSTQLPEDMGSGCAFADYDGDGDWDLFVVDTVGPLTLTPDEVRASRGGCRLYRNDGGTFTDVTAEAGLSDLKGTYMGAAWGDFDNDGYPDLVVTSYGGLRLFHNKGGGTFEDVTKASGLGAFKGFFTGAVWGDADGDGLLDLYVCAYVDYRFDPKDAGKASKFRHATSPFTINPSSYPPVANLYFHNEGKGRFREMALEAGIANSEGRSLSATFADLNDDGRPDIYVANDVSEGALFVNEGNGLFSDRGHEAHVADYRGAMGIAVGDANGDGALDLFVTHWIAEANALYLNKLGGGRSRTLDFEDAAERTGLGQVSTDDIAFGTEFLDVDGDGLPDIVVANGSTFEEPSDTRKLVPMPMRLFRNLGEKGFVDVAPLSGADLTVPRVGRGLAIADVDGDLREEIAVVVNGGKFVLLKAEGGPANHRIAIRCAGRKSNRSAFGTRLVLEAGGRRQVHEIGAGSSYLSQSAPEAIFGLGAATKADVLSVRWPSGAAATFHELAGDRAYLLVEGESAPRVLPDFRAKTLAFWDAYNGARAAFAKGDFAASIAAYRKALEIDPRHEDCRYALGNLLLERGDRAAAKAEFEALLKIQPRSQRGHGALGDLLADPASGPLRDLAAARKNYESAGGIYTEETGWVVRSGEVALATGDFAGAERTFRKVLVSNPRSFQALYFLGYLASRQKRNDTEGAKLFDAAFAALGPQASPAPGEGDVKKAEKALPARGAFAGHWAYLSQGKVRRDDAWLDLDRRIGRSPAVKVR